MNAPPAPAHIYAAAAAREPGPLHERLRDMTKPIPDKAEVALEYPEKFYVGTFERSARFDAHLDKTGIALVLERPGDSHSRKSVHLHINYGLFADILRELAATVSEMPPDDVMHRGDLTEAAAALHQALAAGGRGAA
jgi:hypothetical protein